MKIYHESDKVMITHLECPAGKPLCYHKGLHYQDQLCEVHKCEEVSVEQIVLARMSGKKIF